MANKPNNIISRADLTTYAHGIAQDEQAARNLIKALAPVVPTGGTTGRYNKFEDTQSFKAYSNAGRAIGGQAHPITFLSDTADYTVKPYGLRISVDEFERRQAGEQVSLLEQAKVLSADLRELVIERAMALPDDRLSLGRFKVIVLMVLWSQEQNLDTLIVEELLSDAEPEHLH